MKNGRLQKVTTDYSNLSTIERKGLRKIFGPVYYTETRHNADL